MAPLAMVRPALAAPRLIGTRFAIFLRDEALACPHPLDEKGSRLERLIARAVRERRKTVADDGETDPIGVIHRAAAPRRPAIAVDPHDVDVLRAQGDAFGEDSCTLVHHGIDN